MKSHSVKSNAKRAARKLCELYPGLVTAEPLADGQGGWHALVAAADGFDPLTLPAGTFAEVEFIAADGRVGAPSPMPEPAPVAIRDTPAGRVADGEVVEAAKLANAEASPLDIGDNENPAFLTKRKMPEPIMAAPAAVPPVAAAKALPARAASTPEEIEARRAERRTRVEADKANPKSAPANPAKSVTKADTIVKLCSRPTGATSEELQTATGWQRHTLRGYIAGTLRKRGHAIDLVRDGDRKFYRINAA